MKDFTPSIWTKEEAKEIFGVEEPNLSLRTNMLISYWNGFEYKASINNTEEAKLFIQSKGLKEHKAQVRGHLIGFADSKVFAEYMLRRKNV